MVKSRRKKPSIFLTRLRDIGFARIGACMFLGVVGASFATSLAISGVTRIKAPQAALLAMPNESVALASRADQLFFADPDSPPREVELFALRALKNQAVNAKALRVLGYVADAKGESARAEKYVRMAAKLSRREPGAQLWLIEAAARSGDASTTLAHYDIALRTKPDTQAILFPRLLSAIEDPKIRSALKPFIRSDSNWAESFFSYANTNSKDLPVLVALILESGGLKDLQSARNQNLTLLGRLVNEGYFQEARRIYLQLPRAKASRLRQATFDTTDIDGSAGAIGWTISDDPDVGATFVKTNNERQVVMSIFANAATTKPITSKLLYLPAGGYVFAAHLNHIDRGSGGYLKWQLRCPTAERLGAFWTIESSQRFMSAPIQIPFECPVQYLDLIVSGGNGQTGLEATIASVSISPAKN